MGGLLASSMLSGVALAQSSPSSPSADQIINSLKPTGAVSDTTRGIKPLAPGDTAVAPAPMATPAAVQATSPTGIHTTPPTANLNVVFRSGSADLTPQAITVLNHLGQALTSSQLSSYHFKIVGHTDTTGTADKNLALSQQRADAVKNYLASKFNVSPDRLDATGTGESDLLVPTPPNTPEVRNRRVEIVNLGQ
ncbi:MAG: flagellar motor protein MotB [Acidocella sp. 20-57-95]|nr:MAG: flagellar motor protein MotB [Acidocella sp. 20-57-95]OYV62452.1 MAG: flagellar motor protein MotB [Acidocella sp. 21-58-7]